MDVPGPESKFSVQSLPFKVSRYEVTRIVDFVH
jgi:hypothetical protein